MPYTLNKAKFDAWLAGSKLFRGAAIAGYSLVDGRPIYWNEETDADEKLHRYVFKLLGTQDPIRFPEDDSFSRAVVQFCLVEQAGHEPCLVAPSAHVIIEVAAARAADDSLKPRWRFDDDTPERLASQRADRLLLEGALRLILPNVEICMEPK